MSFGRGHPRPGRHEVVEALPVRPPLGVESVQLVELHQAVGCAQLIWLEVVADGVEHEHRVIGRAI